MNRTRIENVGSRAGGRLSSRGCVSRSTATIRGHTTLAPPLWRCTCDRMENDGEKCWHLLRSDHARSLPNVTAPPYPFLLKRFPLLASASHVAAEGPFSAMTRCSGKTRAGNRCSITSASTMKDDRGRLVAQPLRCGGEFCALHAKPFCVRPAQVDESRAVFLVSSTWRRQASTSLVTGSSNWPPRTPQPTTGRRAAVIPRWSALTRRY